MFLYLVAPVVTLLIIFGLLHAKRLDDWLRSSIRCSLTLYNGLICRRFVAVAPIQASSSLLNTEEVEEEDPLLNNTLASERISVRDRIEPEDIFAQRTTFDLRKERSLNAPRYSFEDLLSEEREKDLGLSSAIRNVQLGTTKDDDAVRTVREEAKENIFESLRNSIDKTNNYPTSRLNKQIYNMILRETLKDNEARQKLLDNDKTKFNESSLPIEIKEQLPSSSENRVERENDIDE